LDNAGNIKDISSRIPQQRLGEKKKKKKIIFVRPEKYEKYKKPL
jgi:hypothetical protein